MLKEVNRLTKRKEFGYIYKHGKTYHTKYLTLIYVPTKFKNPRIGFSVSKKIGKAWLRNKVKRQLRDVVRNILPNINPNYNYIFVAKPDIATVDYETIKNTITYIFNNFEIK